MIKGMDKRCIKSNDNKQVQALLFHRLYLDLAKHNRIKTRHLKAVL